MINKLGIISDMNDKTILKWASKTCQQNIFQVVVSASFLYNICLHKKKLNNEMPDGFMQTNWFPFFTYLTLFSMSLDQYWVQ